MIINLGLIVLGIALPAYFWLYFQLNKCEDVEGRQFGKFGLVITLLGALTFVIYAMHADLVVNLSNLVRFSHSASVSEQYDALAK